jgi:Holliday junction resolvase RusA-like endonuclease
MTTVLTLPAPPSVNQLFKTVHVKGKARRAPSAQYTDWKGHAGWRLREQRPERVDGPVLLVISVERTSASSDIDNRVKALIDLLVDCNVIDDDKHVVGFCIAWAPATAKLARVMILPAGNYAFDFHLSQDGASGGFYLAPPQDERDVA